MRKTAYTCPKCDGRGIINGFRHYASGICFECGGAKIIYLDPITNAQKVQIAERGKRDDAIIALANRIGLNADGKTYNPIGCLILDSDAEFGVWAGWELATAGSLAHRYGQARCAFYREVQSIVDRAIETRTILPSQVARLSGMATERASFPETLD